MRFLIVGCGSIGTRHAGILLELGHEVLGYNRGPRRRNEIRERFGIQVYDDLEEMLSSERADAAIICTPNNLHTEHALAAARSDLHLFIEKPVSHERSDLDLLAEEVERRDLIVHVGANMRYHVGPATVKDHVESGKIGRPLWASFWGGMHLPDWHPGEDYHQLYSASENTGGGAVLDFVHELDLILWMFGPPERVMAMAARSGWLDIETEDVADAVLGYGGGLQINLHVDYLQRPFQRGIRVVGDGGWVEWDLFRQHIEWFDHAERRLGQSSYSDDYDHGDMYVEQMKSFVRCLEASRDSESSLRAGRRALELALRIKASSKNSRFMEWNEPC